MGSHYLHHRQFITHAYCAHVVSRPDSSQRYQKLGVVRGRKQNIFGTPPTESIWTPGIHHYPQRSSGSDQCYVCIRPVKGNGEGDNRTSPRVPASGGRRIAATMAPPSRHFANALNPDWRNTTVHLLIQDSWAASTEEKDVADLTQSMSAVAYDLRRLAPDSGAYINEA